MEVSVDRTRCAGLGICESIAPSYFEVSDGGDLILVGENVTDDALADVEAAVECCPTEALRLHR